MDVLASLYTHGGMLSPTQLYDLTIFSSGGMTKVLKKLQERGFIYRKEDAKDKRCMLVCLSQSGEERGLFSTLLKKVLININSVK